jgi:hypothetical protein
MRFYVLKQDTLSRQCATDIFGIDEKMDNALKCPACGIYYSDLRWLPPYKVELERRGREFGDIVKSAGMHLFLTDKGKHAWEESKLIGVSDFDPVEIVHVKPQKAAARLPVYWHVAINRIPTAVDMSRSTFAYFIRERPSCTYCAGGYDAVAGFEIDQNSWTGEDIFEPRNMSGAIVVTQPFVDMVKKYELTHAVFIPTEKYIFDPLHLIVSYTESKA